MVIAPHVLIHQLLLEVSGLAVANDRVSGKIEKKILIGDLGPVSMDKFQPLNFIVRQIHWQTKSEFEINIFSGQDRAQRIVTKIESL